MSRFVLEEVSSFKDFAGSEELADMLSLSNNEHNGLTNVRVSPDSRHIHIILQKPEVGLMTFDKYERPVPVQNQKKLDLWLTRTAPIVDVVYLDHKNSRIRGTAVAAVVYDNGKAEFWKFQDCKVGWHLLQTSDLCNSPRAKVVSVCASSQLLIWCEERPPSESSSASPLLRNNLRFCVCRRDYEVEEGAVILGGVKITLHSSPKVAVLRSGECVHLLPDVKAKPPWSISKFFLTWLPHRDTFTVNTTCNNTPVKHVSARESDFKRLVTDCMGYLSILEPPEILNVTPTGCGGLLLLLSTGWICLLQKDGILRRVYKLAENCFVQHQGPTSMCVFQDTLALIIEEKLYLVDIKCGKELEKILLKKNGLLYINQDVRQTPHLLSENGLFVVANKETECKDCSSKRKLSGSTAVNRAHSGAVLVEAVFEEACKYYQQRSLSSTQLTVEALKKGGRFQAPISLASILRNYLCSTSLRRGGAELSQNGWGECNAGQDKLMCSLEAELRALVSLEEVKGGLVKGSAKEVETMCYTLVEKEVVRLLSISDLDKDSLTYLNSLFSIFPCQAWKAVQVALQLHYNGEGSLSSKAPPDMWKCVLSPALHSSSTASLLLSNGQPKHSRSLKGDQNCKPRAGAASSPAVLPVFELLCQSVFHFQPSWLPKFLQLAQQQQGSAGLGLPLASSSWSFSGGRGREAGENHVPLYKRALCILFSSSPDRNRHQDLEVELLLVSERPNAVLQALRILMGKQQWEKVMQVAQEFCKQGPLLNKEIFTTLLCEVSHHRDLDPYLDLLWALCPEDFTVTTILNLVLKNLPSSNSPTVPSSLYASCPPSPPPFVESCSSQLTVGLLKPLLRKVLQRETKPSQRYADILQSPSYPPPALPRHPTNQSSISRDPSMDSAPRGNITPTSSAESQSTLTDLRRDKTWKDSCMK
uniref:HPS6 biosis of lysosomal organelles complex 2 subunit 3 n=1 Tax=Oryzias latipes TaxID=8090 RepID=H2LWF9_ORYLA